MTNNDTPHEQPGILSSSDVVIRRAAYDDLPEILELQRRAFLTEAELHDNYNIEPLTQTLDSVRNDFMTHVFLKATHQDRIIGSVKAQESEGYCWIGKLIVDPGFRRRGLAKRLMSEIENIFSDSSCYYLYTALINKGNISLYESLGYGQGDSFTDESGVVLVRLEKRTGRIDR